MNRKQRRAQGPQAKPTEDLGRSFTEGMKLYRAKSFTQAEKIFKNIVQKAPHHADSQHILGSIYLGKGQAAKALVPLKAALDLQPDNAEYYNSLGKALKDNKKFDKAIECFTRALDLQSDYADAHFSIVTLKQKNPDIDIDLKDLNKKYASPELAEAYKTIGQILRSKDKYKESIASFIQATQLQPDDAEAFSYLALAHLVNNETADALFSIKKAIQKDPDNPEYKIYLSYILSNNRLTQFDPDLKALIEEVLAHKNVSLQLFTSAWFSHLLIDPEFSAINDALALDNYDAFEKWISALPDLTFLNEPYLLNGLKKLLIPHRELERFFTFCRRHLLNSADTTPLLPFLTALAEHSFLNEYVFHETTEEKEQVAALEKDIRENFTSFDDAELIRKTALLSCYKALFEWMDDNTDLQDRCRAIDDKNFQSVFTIQMEEPLEERAIKENIEHIGEIENKISQAVREQYEENPYPRWNAIKTVKTTMNDNDFLANRTNARYKILLPGCGTGQQSIQNCVTFPDSDILAVDLSQSSLAYAIRKTKEYGFDNITYKHADILQLNTLDRQFDIIECTGVIHHMEDPMAGWRVLTDLLRPGGYMKLGLYSEIARQGIVTARELIADMGLGNTADDIRKGRALIKDHPDQKALSTIFLSSDFYSLSMCRDLVFHVQEHRFTIPQIQDCLKELGLQFQSFSLSNAQVSHGYKKMFPDDADGNNLNNWHQYEEANPTTFAKMYQFWMHKPG